jgi:GNAT superfamily N-acetyltransferase
VVPLKRSSTSTFEIRPLDRDDRDWVAGLIEKQWGSTKIVTRGKIHNADELPGFAAMMDNEPIGLITYRMEDKECEIITLNSLREGIGVGSALVNAVEKVAVDFRCKRLWVVTTNDNVDALRFYQKKGFELVAVHRNAVEQSRKLKPEIPSVGKDGIPLRDEIELEITLGK